MPKVITVIEENGEELWDCAYESLDQARKDSIDYLESLRSAEPGKWTSLSYHETQDPSGHGRRGLMKMSAYASLDQVELELIPLVLG